jgi:hypothetical protein
VSNAMHAFAVPSVRRGGRAMHVALRTQRWPVS